MLKANPQTKDIPVIFLSNFSQEKEIEKGIGLGAVDFLVTAYVMPSELPTWYINYLENPQTYIKRYPVYKEAQKMKFAGKTTEEVNKERDAFIQKRFSELGIK